VDRSDPRLHELTVRPEVADPAADARLEDQLAILDTRVAPLGRLVVYLAGANGKPAGTRPMLHELASYGFHVVSPHYANDYGIVDVCAPVKDPDDDCHGKVRLEAFEGKDHSPHITISRANSAEGRVVRLLQHLAKAHPAGDWGAFVDGEQPRWADIVVAGHSHGASSAGLISKHRRVRRAVMLSGPFDNRQGAPAAWTTRASATPIEDVYGFSHAGEPQHAGHLKDWAAMGLAALGPVMAVDHTAPPFGGSHQLVLRAAPATPKGEHGATTAGRATPKAEDGTPRMRPVWRHMFGVDAR
jgi:hypothetical protein